FWNINTVGMLRTPYFDAKSWLASTSTFPTTAFPSKSVANSSIVGPNILHGPHHSAQKSTTTGLSDFNTTSSNVASVISKAISNYLMLLLNTYKYNFFLIPFTSILISFVYSNKNLINSIGKKTLIFLVLLVIRQICQY